MNSALLVSVVMTARDAADTIGEAIASVLAQTHSNFELLIIDHGSVDSTSAEVSRFSDSRIHLHNYTEGSLTEVRNFALNLTKGDFFCPLDADDTWKPTKLQVQLERLVGVERPSVAYCSVEFIDEYGKVTGRPKVSLPEGEVFSTLLKGNFLMCGSNVMVPKELLIAGNLSYDERLSAASDWDFGLQLASQGVPFLFAGSELVSYRRHRGQVTTRLENLEAGLLQVIRKWQSHSAGSRKAFASAYLYLFEQVQREERPRSSKLTTRLRIVLRAVLYNPRLILIMVRAIGNRVQKAET